MANECFAASEARQAVDKGYMRRALQLALRGSGWVNPNPLVGAVIARDGRVIGEGWHTAFGQPHAERHALANCTEDPRGATLYVTLEPCCHTGKTPPCTEAVIGAGIARVVMGAPDPNPKVAGGGVAQLQQAGIEVTQGVLVDECRQVNRAFFHYIQTGLPYVILKYAMTLDGKIATRTGASQWITAEAARRRAHEDRQRYAAVMVGVGTVIADDPLLTCRLSDFEQSGEPPQPCHPEQSGEPPQPCHPEQSGEPPQPCHPEQGGQAPQPCHPERRPKAGVEGSPAGQPMTGDRSSLESTRPSDGGSFDYAACADPLRTTKGAAGAAPPKTTQGEGDAFAPAIKNPARIVCDTHLRTPLGSRLVQTAKSAPTYIATAETDPAKRALFADHGCHLITVPAAAEGHIDLKALMRELGALGIDSVIVEGGADVNWSVLASGVVQLVQAYVAPKLFGGVEAPSAIGGLGVDVPDHAVKLGAPQVTRLGDGLLIECEVG